MSIGAPSFRRPKWAAAFLFDVVIVIQYCLFVKYILLFVTKIYRWPVLPAVNLFLSVVDCLGAHQMGVVTLPPQGLQDGGLVVVAKGLQRHL